MRIKLKSHKMLIKINTQDHLHAMLGTDHRCCNPE